LGVGLALGVLVVVGFEFMDDRIHNEKEIKALLPTAIIAEIPEIVTLSDRQISKRRMAFGWVTATLVFATILAGSAFTYFRS
jgi:hypothetical protein